MPDLSSHVEQPPQAALRARRIEYPVDRDFFQWSDPPAAMRSPQQQIHRTCKIEVVSAVVSFAPSTNTTFEVLVLDRTDNSEVDILQGRGVIFQNEDEASISPVLFPVLIPRRHRIVVNLSNVGTDMLGFIVALVYK